MIARLTGKLVIRRPDHLVLDVGGVGYRVFVSLSTFYDLPDIGSTLTMAVQTVVRDDAIHLYGFSTEAEKESFGLLTSVSGVGPKLALGILSGITPDQLWVAVKSGDTARLTKVPGIGKKTAARLVVELEGKLPQEEMEESTTVESVVEDALSALINLGYPETQAKKLIEKARASLGSEAAVEDLLRQALKNA